MPPCLQTKAPYPEPPARAYSAPPPGYRPVFTQMVARHGARGLTAPKSDLALYRLWETARAEQGLTPLGASLGPVLRRMLQVHALLGRDDPAITRPGYGSESRLGQQEQQALARRLVQRLPQLWQPFQAQGEPPGRIQVMSSGVPRAADSARFFADALVRAQPALATAVHWQAPDRYLLYFHRLDPRRDPPRSALETQVLDDSLAYQRYVAQDAGLRALPQRSAAQLQFDATALEVLQPLFTPAFLQRLQAGERLARNDGQFIAYPATGGPPVTVQGDGRTALRTPRDVAQALYDVYAIAPLLRNEAQLDLRAFLPAPAACRFAAQDGALAFFGKGAGWADRQQVTHRMARALVQELLDATAQALQPGPHDVARLRFAHAETILPLAAALGLPAAGEPQPPEATTPPPGWQGDQAAPMAANLQWDVFRNHQGHAIVRLLFNERESRGAAACDGARLPQAPAFYDWSRLRECLRPN